MFRKVILFCCLALSRAGIIETDFSPATAVSYSTIRLGTLSIKGSPDPTKYDINSPTYNYQNKAQERQIDGNYPAVGTINFNRRLDTSSSNIYPTPTNTESIFPQYIPTGSRQLNLARPLHASRNIPESPLPEFATVPTLLKTKGLSAYASIPLETASKVDTTSYWSKDLPSTISNPRTDMQSYLDAPIVSYSSNSEPIFSRTPYDHDSYTGPTYSY